MVTLCDLIENGRKRTVDIKCYRPTKTQELKEKRFNYIKSLGIPLPLFVTRHIMKGRSAYLEKNMFPYVIKIKERRFENARIQHFVLWALREPSDIEGLIEKKMKVLLGKRYPYVLIKNDKMSMPIWHIHLGIVLDSEDSESSYSTIK